MKHGIPSTKDGGGLNTALISIIIVVLITYLVLHLENPTSKVLGRRSSLVITRVFGVFIAVSPIEYIIQGF